MHSCLTPVDGELVLSFTALCCRVVCVCSVGRNVVVACSGSEDHQMVTSQMKCCVTPNNLSLFPAYLISQQIYLAQMVDSVQHVNEICWFHLQDILVPVYMALQCRKIQSWIAATMRILYVMQALPSHLSHMQAVESGESMLIRTWHLYLDTGTSGSWKSDAVIRHSWLLWSQSKEICMLCTIIFESSMVRMCSWN